MTWRPSHLTGTNGCTRLPVEATARRPNHHLKLMAPAVPQKNSSDQAALHLNSDGPLPPLGMPFSQGRILNWVRAYLILQCLDTYGLCVGGVWHYSSFKNRIFNCVTRPDFIMPHSETVSHKSTDRQQFITVHTKQGQRDHVFFFYNVWKTDAITNWRKLIVVKKVFRKISIKNVKWT